MPSFCRPCPGATALAVLQSKALPFYDSFFNNPLPYLLSSPVEAIEMHNNSATSAEIQSTATAAAAKATATATATAKSSATATATSSPSAPPALSTSTSPLRRVEDMDEDPSTNTVTAGVAGDTSPRFPPDEESRLLTAAHLQKSSGNTLFQTSHYLAAIDAYTLALQSTPTYLSHETAILHSNLSACHLKLSAPTLALEHAAEAIRRRPGWTKPLLRRGKAREMLGTWKELETAVGEYEDLLGVGRVRELREGERVGESVKLEADLTEAERRECVRSLARCRKALEEVRASEVGDAMKGLKTLGDGLLRPFGISTSDFGMKPDGKGGYSLQFQRGGGQA